MENLIALVDRIIYSDLKDLGYDCVKVERDRQRMIDFFANITKGRKGKTTPVQPKKHSAVRTLSKDELEAYNRERTIKDVLNLPLPQQRIVLEQLARSIVK